MTSSDIQVQGSNDWSIASKLSTVRTGYYDDQFISCFVSKPVRRSALIHRGYYVRAKAMDFVFNQFISQHPKCQVVSFGAGFDSSFFRLKQQGYTLLKYVEIDFPEVVQRKWHLIQSNPSCMEHTINGNYHLVSADLRDLPTLSSLLCQELKLEVSEPTLFISECSITYMDEVSSSKLIQWCADTFHKAVFTVYEQIQPLDGFGHVMQNHFNLLGIPLLSLLTYQNEESHQLRYIQKGWSSCEVYNMNEFCNLIPQEEWKRIQRIEQFDEYEGFHWKCSHYVILSATKGLCSPLLPPRDLLPISQTLFPKELVSWELRESSVLRYGQASTSVGNKLWMTGGFGARSSQGHGRLNDLRCLANDGGVEYQSTHPKLSRMHHSVTVMGSDEELLVIFGGRTNPSVALSDVGVLNRHTKDLNWIQPGNMVPWPAARWRHSSAKFNSNRLMMSGGRSAVGVLKDAWLLELGSAGEFTWTTFAELPGGRHSHSSSIWEGQIVIFGGLNEEEELCRQQVLVSHLENPGWISPDWNGPLPLKRYSHQALISADKLILVGGVNRSASPGVCVIDLKSWSCVEYCLPVQDPCRPVILAGHSSLLERDSNKIRCWGGGGSCFSFGTHLNAVMLTIEIPGP